MRGQAYPWSVPPEVISASSGASWLCTEPCCSCGHPSGLCRSQEFSPVWSAAVRKGVISPAEHPQAAPAVLQQSSRPGTLYPKITLGSELTYHTCQEHAQAALS